MNQEDANKRIHAIQKKHDEMVNDTYRKLTSKLLKDLFQAGYNQALEERGLK